MPSDSKHRQIYRELLSDIENGAYSTTSRLPSEAQLVSRFGVSRPTVARALRDLQIEGRIERRAGSGSYLVQGDRAPAPATRQLGVLVPPFGVTDFFEAICGELAGLARAHDHGLLWGGGTHGKPSAEITPEQAEEICEHFIERAVSGVFFVPFEFLPDQEVVSQRIAERLRQAGIAVILLDRDLVPYPDRSEFDLVGIDNFAAGYMLADHLIKLGLKRIAFLAHAKSAPTVAARIAGAREALIAAKLPPEGRFVYMGNPEDLAFVRNLVAGRTLDAVICGNDHTAAQLMQSLARTKVRVPQDLRVVGCDDLRYARLLTVPLTTIHQPCREIAIVAMRTMMERIADPTLPARNVLLAPRLVVRSSCGAYLH